jgi:hypothetical protein
MSIQEKTGKGNDLKMCTQVISPEIHQTVHNIYIQSRRRHAIKTLGNPIIFSYLKHNILFSFTLYFIIDRYFGENYTRL